MQIVVDKTRSTPWDIGQAVIDAIKKIINAYIEKAVVNYLSRLNGNLKDAG